MRAGGRLGPLLAVCVLVACTARATDVRPSPPDSAPATLDDLRAAFARWRRSEVTVTYRTERQRPGLPMSAHQCLRGFVDEREDIPIALELCDPGGLARIRLTGRTRWSIDVEEGGTILRAIVQGRRGLTCVEGDLCRRRVPSAIVRSFPFHELIGGVDDTLDEISVGSSGTVTIARRESGDTDVDCFEVGTATASATWCFDDEGILRTLRIRTPGRAPTIAEAARVSSEPAAAAAT
jgi:hypothetical protein